MPPMNDQEQLRWQRRQDLLKSGLEVYPARTNRTVTIGQLLDTWADDRTETVAGRVRAIRLQGASAFLNIEDETATIQIFLQAKKIETFETLSKQIDLGDFLEFSGRTFTTKRGEKTVDATAVRWLAKALRPMPSEWHGLEDTELRYRHRELDVLINPETKQTFILRSQILSGLRSFLDQQGFIEVETPTLHPLAGGANARPFVTHHNALDADFFLRIAPELYLKRLIVGGYGRVYEIGRSFRNEGIDREHNPEFTMLELYAAYTDYTWMMNLVEKLLTTLATKILGQNRLTYKGTEILLATPFPRKTYREVILEHTKIDIENKDATKLLELGRELGTDLNDKWGRGKILDEIFKTHVRPKLQQPVFIIDYPVELSPLVKRKTDQPDLVERFQLLIGGTELFQVYSELNDPVEQRQRFEEQEQLRQGGDDEAQRIDENFLQALEYGMPPTGGLGMGVDRLVALFADAPSLKEVILFPTLKPEQS